jgi:hypothetical protein
MGEKSLQVRNETTSFTVLSFLIIVADKSEIHDMFLVQLDCCQYFQRRGDIQLVTILTFLVHFLLCKFDRVDNYMVDSWRCNFGNHNSEFNKSYITRHVR